MTKVIIRDEPPFDVAAVPHRGAYDQIGRAGGRVAVLTHKGPYSGHKAGWNALYADCLPGSGESASGAALIEVYLNARHDTAPDDLLTEICVPLA